MMSATRSGSDLHVTGIALFLFIPIVLFLFLHFPFGILPSFAIAIVIIICHRFAARPFFLKHKPQRCFWCGRTSAPRRSLSVDSGEPLLIDVCREGCGRSTLRFFDFTARNKTLLRAGIFLPLAWYVAAMLLHEFKLLSIPVEWNRFVFQFFIACTVVALSFLYVRGKETKEAQFPFPIHNLFLLGARNTLFVFRLVGIWWIIWGIYFLTSA